MLLPKIPYLSDKSVGCPLHPTTFYMRHYQFFCNSIQSMEENIFKDSLNDSLFWRIAAHCPPSNRGSGPILSQPDALANLEDRLLEALAPTKHDLELSAFDLMLAAQYEEVKLTSQSIEAPNPY